MRVIGGSVRGRTLKGPPKPRSGQSDAGVRPTSDLIRGVVFNMLDAMGADYDRVLDLYAGTGALGIEALSRGDGTCDFVEQDAGAARVIDENLAHTGLASRARVHRIGAASAASRLSAARPETAYTLVLADPPYYDDAAPTAILAVAELLAPGGVLVVEQHRSRPVATAIGDAVLYRERRHGDTVVAIYEKEQDT